MDIKLREKIMNNKKSKVVILMFLVLILIVLISLFLWINSKPEVKHELSIENNTVQDELITENPNIEEASQDQIIEMAKKSIEKYEALIPYQESSIGAMPYLLAELDLATKDELDELVNGTYDRETYVKTNVSYDDFRTVMLNYMTEELFDEEYSHYKNIDGYVGIQNVGGGFIVTSVQNVELISEAYDKEEYIFRVTIRDDEIYDHYLNGEEFEESEYLFEIPVKCEYNNGAVVVSEYNVETETTERMKNVSLEVVDGSVTSKSLELLITDNNEPSFTWGEHYKIQEKVNDIWVDVNPKRQATFTDLGYRVDENNQINQTINFSSFYKLNKNSTYRVAKQVDAGAHIYFCSNEFKID